VHAPIQPKQQWKRFWKLKWNLLTHPLCSPHLAPSDLYLFRRLKSDLQGMRFADNTHDAVTQTLREWLRHQPQAFFEEGIGMLTEGWRKKFRPGHI
jgi:hypothetical protein